MGGQATFGKYVLLRKLATGGMGEVFLAKQVGPSGFEKLLVIKRILAHHHDKHEYLDMFLSEAKLVARLTHGNIIQIHEMGQIDGDYFIAMEYLRGKSLRDLIDALRARGEFLPLSYVVDLAMKLCDGLGYAHAAKDIRGRSMNIIHRDVNPHNVLISYTGDLKLIDFGIAKSEMASVHTATGTIKGKFVYMSPEQSAADPIDRRSDIFSLGIVLYEMIALENPFVRQNVVLSLEAIQRQPAPAIGLKRDDADALAPILERALEKDPEHRYQSCEEMRDDLRDLLRAGAVTPEEVDISAFLSEVFREDIEEEDRLLAEADRATTPFVQRLALPAPRSVPPDEEDQDVTRRGRPHSGTPIRGPRPITQKPFDDDEPTIAGDLDDIAHRSKMKGAAGLPQPEPTGQVLTLIPPEDVVPGTSEQLAPDPLVMEPNTRKDRIPSDAPSALLPRPPPPSNTADLPPAPLPPERVSAPPTVPFAAFVEPLSSSALRNAETKELRAAPRPSSAADIPDTPVGVAHDDPSEPVRDPSVSLPVYAGPWRRSMVIAAALVFVLTAFAGYFVTRALTGSGPARKSQGAPVEPEAVAPPSDLAPAPDPKPSVAEAPAAVAPQDDAKKAREDAPADRPASRAKATEDARAKAREDEKHKAPEAEARAAKAREDDKQKARDAEARAAKLREDDEARAAKAREDEKQKARDTEARDAKAREEEAKRAREEEARAAKAREEEQARAAKAREEEQAREEAKAREETKPRAEDGARLGVLTLRTSAGARVEHDGRGAGSAPSSLVIRKGSGKLSLAGDEFSYTIELEYRVEGDGIAVTVQAEPWAIVKHNGISMGRTPQGPVAAGKRHRFSLLRPGESSPVVVSIVWNPAAS